MKIFSRRTNTYFIKEMTQEINKCEGRVRLDIENYLKMSEMDKYATSDVLRGDE